MGELFEVHDEGATMSVNAKTGAAKQSKPAQMSLVPTDVLLQLATLYGNGAKLYDKHMHFESFSAYREALGDRLHGVQSTVNDDGSVDAIVSGKRNWELGYDWSLAYDALHRHLLAFWSGEEWDEQANAPHIICVAWHAFALAHFSNDRDKYGEFDDRPGKYYKDNDA